MKKVVCSFLALMMLCSLMVVNVSASNTYEGEGFRIVTDYELTLYDTDEYLGSIAYEYSYDPGDGEDDTGIAIGVFDCENDEAAEYADYVLENSNGTTFKGYPAVITDNYRSDYDIYKYSITTLRDDVVCIIDMSAMGASNYQIMLEIVDSIEFTDDFANADDGDYYYEEDYDDYEIEASSYWENNYFYIDSNEELYEEVQCEDETLYDYIYYPSVYADNYSNYFEIEIRFPEDINEAVQEWNDMLSDDQKICDSYDYEEVNLYGFTCYQHTFERDNYYTSAIVFSDGDALYLVTAHSESAEILEDICNIVENDLHFKNSPDEAEKTEDKGDKADKADKTSKDKKDEEKSSDDNTTIIIVAIVVTGVVIIAVVAIVVLGKKKKA